MIQGSVSIKADNVITMQKASGETFSFKPGSIVRAEVIDAIDSGLVTLRIAPPAGSAESLDGKIIKAKTNVPLSKSDRILLEANGTSDNISFRYIGKDLSPPQRPVAPKTGLMDGFAEIPQKFLELLGELADSRLKGEDFLMLKQFINSIPAALKKEYPEFTRLMDLLPEIEKLNEAILKGSIEDSGVLMETRLKLSVMSGAEFKELDQKALLLRLKDILTIDSVRKSLRQSGYNPNAISDKLDRFVKNIEYFQLTSTLNDTFATFIPFVWQELNDGELTFKKEQKNGKNTFACDIDLDLTSLGKLSVSIVMYDGELFITFEPQSADTTELLTNEKENLKQRLSGVGLKVGYINVNQSRPGPQGKTHSHGLDIVV